jgi:DNA-binding MarR family transcriptional regulator/GNAT superfamily N-acetyltransferase
MLPDSISRVRRFGRAIASEAVALDSSFVGRGRPPGAARVLNAIGRGFTEVAAIRAQLQLDPGTMSRAVWWLERGGLIRIEPEPESARQRVVTLTESGRREFEICEQLANAGAASLLARFPHPDELLQAMDLVASALGLERVSIEEADPQGEVARWCLGEYYAELERRFEEGFDVARSRDPEPENMVRPRGAFLVALSDELPIGCVGLNGTGGEVAEIKRLWVSPAPPGLGLARRLMAAAETVARELSVKVLRLDTNRALPEATRLYRATGWTEIERFNDDPYADRFFEKRL